MKQKTAGAIVMVLMVGFIMFAFISSEYGVFTESTSLSDFGAFPKRQIDQDYQEALFNYFKNQENEELATEYTNAILSSREDLKTLENSIGIEILRDAPEAVGAANIVTAVLWDYRGYDTIGEATVIFVAVACVGALFRAGKGEEE